MEKRTIKLNAAQAKDLYEKYNELRDTLLHEFSDEELGIKPEPFTWYDLGRIGGHYINADSQIKNLGVGYGLQDKHRNICPTRKDAKSSRAKHMLLQLAKHYNDGETEEEWIDWDDDSQRKYNVFYDHFQKKYRFQVSNAFQLPVVYFKRREDLKKCFNGNRELWEEYFKG